jgi:5-methylcytosine-specific restriction endonuclease McrA
MQCCVDGCDAPIAVKARGWCNTHYHQWYRSRAEPSVDHSCEYCGVTFVGWKRRFCSNDCRAKAAKERSVHERRSANLARSVRCLECNRTFTTSIRYQRFCSGRCRRRAGHRLKNHIRRARIKRLNTERFFSAEIFTRDKWLCQLCGVKTLRSKSGTTHSRAPELDHIIPISKGGAHTRANTQCACRSCNQAKRARLKGQLRLF